ncbi:MAG TPA: carbohydrate ABC transporter permease [Candidatus Ornithocaccomicrobium faecavium]|uniref:Carbohydrate ABC transporter permease n=1 Tax=Candidatus Ornithocaccomicrobium faecavium TaxID=2840890 RepID=A0A9D1P714_9FIRM|nr:carbohydrate ABC transporter permease [Candidatus Ornithocaccomicrobium faecavium]
MTITRRKALGKPKHHAIRRTRGDVVFDVINVFVVALITLTMIYPMWYIIIVSIATPEEAALGGIYLWPKTISFEAYQNVFENRDIWLSYANTVLYTVAHTIYVLLLTIPAAYTLSKKQLPGRVVITWYFFITMFLSGGLIPSYILNRNLGLVNSRWIMILGMGIGYSNLIITRTYFQTSIPNELFESAYIDGATEWQTFLKIALPLSGAIIAVMALYAAVGTWGSWYTAFIYITDQKKWPLQLRLRQILILNQTQSLDYGMMSQEEIEMLQHQAFMVYTMKYAIIFIACAPMLVLYPFVQKYFVKGVMIGSLKG